MRAFEIDPTWRYRMVTKQLERLDEGPRDVLDKTVSGVQKGVSNAISGGLASKASRQEGGQVERETKAMFQSLVRTLKGTNFPVTGNKWSLFHISQLKMNLAKSYSKNDKETGKAEEVFDKYIGEWVGKISGIADKLEEPYKSSITPEKIERALFNDFNEKDDGGDEPDLSDTDETWNEIQNAFFDKIGDSVKSTVIDDLVNQFNTLSNKFEQFDDSIFDPASENGKNLNELIQVMARLNAVADKLSRGALLENEQVDKNSIPDQLVAALNKASDDIAEAIENKSPKTIEASIKTVKELVSQLGGYRDSYEEVLKTFLQKKEKYNQATKAEQVAKQKYEAFKAEREKTEKEKSKTDSAPQAEPAGTQLASQGQPAQQGQPAGTPQGAQ